MSGKKASNERVLLLTLVDLMLQMLFVLLAVNVAMAEKKQPIDEGQAEKESFKADGSLTKLMPVEQIHQRNRELEERNEKLETRLAELNKKLGFGKPPCLCRDGACDPLKLKPQSIARFELRDDGILLTPEIPDTAEADLLRPLASQVIPLERFTSQWRHFARPDCSYWVSFVDMTSSENKLGYQQAHRKLQEIFMPGKVR